MGVVANSTSTFNALGQPGPPLIISLLQMLFLSVPLALLGNHWLGYQGIFLGSVLSVLITAIIAFVWLKTTIRRRKLLAKAELTVSETSTG